jgi:hypothetical protein
LDPGPDRGAGGWDGAVRSSPPDEPEADLPFASRLARDHPWTDDFAERVVIDARSGKTVATRTNSGGRGG